MKSFQIIILVLAAGLTGLLFGDTIKVTNQLAYPIKFTYEWYNLFGKNGRGDFNSAVIEPGKTIGSNEGLLNLKVKVWVYMRGSDIGSDQEWVEMLTKPYSPGLAGQQHFTVYQDFDNKVNVSHAVY